MKNKKSSVLKLRSILAIVALVALIGFSMAACDGPGGPGGGGGNASVVGTWKGNAFTGVKLTFVFSANGTYTCAYGLYGDNDMGTESGRYTVSGNKIRINGNKYVDDGTISGNTMTFVATVTGTTTLYKQ